MAELPDVVPKGPFVAACALVLVGFIAIVFGGGAGIILGSLLVLAGGAIGTWIGLTVWKATE